MEFTYAGPEIPGFEIEKTEIIGNPKTPFYSHEGEYAEIKIPTSKVTLKCGLEFLLPTTGNDLLYPQKGYTNKGHHDLIAAVLKTDPFTTLDALFWKCSEEGNTFHSVYNYSGVVVKTRTFPHSPQTIYLSFEWNQEIQNTHDYNDSFEIRTTMNCMDERDLYPKLTQKIISPSRNNIEIKLKVEDNEWSEEGVLFYLQALPEGHLKEDAIKFLQKKQTPRIPKNLPPTLSISEYRKAISRTATGIAEGDIKNPLAYLNPNQIATRTTA
jgi:hypothetical protein